MEAKRATQALTLNLTRLQIERLGALRSGADIDAREMIELERLVLEKASLAAAVHLAAQAAAEGALRVIKLRPHGLSPWLIFEMLPGDLSDFAEEMRAGEPGDVLEVEIAEMSRSELEALPEFEGW